MNLKYLKLIVTSITLALQMVSSVSADVVIPEKAAICASCHGALGNSTYPHWPNIAGQKRAYLISQLEDFRDGSRYDPWMTPMAEPLSDEEIQKLADFFSQL